MKLASTVQFAVAQWNSVQNSRSLSELKGLNNLATLRLFCNLFTMARVFTEEVPRQLEAQETSAEHSAQEIIVSRCETPNVTTVLRFVFHDEHIDFLAWNRDLVLAWTASTDEVGVEGRALTIGSSNQLKFPQFNEYTGTTFWFSLRDVADQPGTVNWLRIC